MGFKINVKELVDYKEDITRTSDSIKAQIDVAIQSLRSIQNSQAMYGKVGQAVSETITTNHVPSLIGLKSSYNQLSIEVEKTLSEFKSTTNETSNNAIIKEDILKEIPSKLDSILEGYNQRTTAISNIYGNISDLISLELPKSNLPEAIESSKKHVQKIQKNVLKFESGKNSDSIETLLEQINKQIERITSSSNLGYGSSEFLKFSNKNEFVSAMEQSEQDMNKEEKLKAEALQKQKEKDFIYLSALEFFMKYPDERKKLKEAYNNIAGNIHDAYHNLSDYVKNMKSFNNLIDMSDKIFSKDYVFSKFGKMGDLAHEHMRHSWRLTKKWIRKADFKYIDKSARWLNSSFTRNIKQMRYKTRNIAKVTKPLNKIKNWITNPAKAAVKKAVSYIPKVEVLGKISKKMGWIGLSIDVSFSGYEAYTDPKSDDYKDVGKSVIHAGIDQIKKAGPIEGAIAGSPGGPWGTVIGFGLGSLNTLWGVFSPNTKDDAFNWVEEKTDSIYEAGKEVINDVGNGISQGIDTVTSWFKGRSLTYGT